MEELEIKLKTGTHYKVEIFFTYVYDNQKKEQRVSFDFYALKANSGIEDIKNCFYNRYLGVENLRVGSITEAEGIDDFLERLQQCF